MRVAILAIFMACGFAFGSAAIHAEPASAARATDLLPSLTPEEAILADHDLVRDTRTRKVWVRFSNAIVNRGAGKLQVIGKRSKDEARNADLNNDEERNADPDTDEEQDADSNNVMPAYQRIYRADGTWHEELIGRLVYHYSHKHFHFEGAARYRLIEVVNRKEVVLRESPKVSFCLADSIVVDETLEGYSLVPVFNSCAHNPQATFVSMGISVGWADVYGKDLVGQAFDVTELMEEDRKTYILESTTNPDKLIYETNRKHPASVRVEVEIGKGVPVKVGVLERPGV